MINIDDLHAISITTIYEPATFLNQELISLKTTLASSKIISEIIPTDAISHIPCSSQIFTTTLNGIIKKEKSKEKICHIQPFSIDRLPLTLKFKELVDMLEIALQTFTPSLNKEVSKVTFTKFNTRDELWSFKLETMKQSMILVNKFAHNIPGFDCYLPVERRKFVLNCTYPIIACIYSLSYNPITEYFKWSFSDSNNIMVVIEKFHIIRPLFANFTNFSKKVKFFKLTPMELACLCTIFLYDMSNDINQKELFLKVLEWYEKDAFPNQKNRYFLLLSFLRHMFENHRVHANILYKFHTDPVYSNLARFVIEDKDFQT